MKYLNVYFISYCNKSKNKAQATNQWQQGIFFYYYMELHAITAIK